MRIAFSHIPVRDYQHGTAERVQRLEHGGQPRFIDRLEYLVQHEQVQSLVPVAVAVHEFLHGKDGRQIHTGGFACRELAERAAVHAVAQQ